ncbi:hypothetical protein bsdtw1_03624 [Clostridium fungisolvens]|uniref:Uncharacterized protein n=1 Tax=Clostridium fungisolvens TaxID=1604897 RepID=A0A6V8SLQ1_9CLOT|nr:hypothetical protein bsdtw1_03624 [Clostridium fungisolvens]
MYPVAFHFLGFDFRWYGIIAWFVFLTLSRSKRFNSEF